MGLNLAVLRLLEFAANALQRAAHAMDCVAIQPVHGGKQLPCHPQRLQRLERLATLGTQPETCRILPALLRFPVNHSNMISMLLGTINFQP